MKKQKTLSSAQSRAGSGFARVLTIVAMMLLFLTTGATSAMADPVDGDVNGDDVCDIADVAAVISVMQGDNTYAATADVNGDAEVNVGDIAQIYSIMAQQSGTTTGTKVVLTANDITVANGNEAGLTIRMDYETGQTITGVAFSLYLPDGILLKGFDTKEAQDAAKASALKKACDLGEDGVWGEDATSGWLSVKQKDDGGLLFVFIDQDDKTEFESTKAPLITIKVHAVADVAATASIKNISITSDQNASIDCGAIANAYFGINQAAVPEEPAVELGTVKLAEGTVDADKWTITPAEATTTGVKAGTEIKATYSGTKRVKSVKAEKKVATITITGDGHSTTLKINGCTTWADVVALNPEVLSISPSNAIQSNEHELHKGNSTVRAGNTFDPKATDYKWVAD